MAFLSELTALRARVAASPGRLEKRRLVADYLRGLSPEDLKNASPDTAALAKAQSYRADKPAAERFARDGKLAAVTIEYKEYKEGARR